MNTTTSPDLSALVDRWVERGIISPDQAQQIRDDVGAPPPATPTGVPTGTEPWALARQPEPAAAVTTPQVAPHEGPSIVVEALGYLGGLIAVIALGLIIGNVWESLPVGARIGLGAVVCLVLLGAGAAVPAGRADAAHRLRAVLWAGATLAFAATTALLLTEGFDRTDDWVPAVVAGATTVIAAALWRLHPTVLQQAVTFAAGLVALSTTVAVFAEDTFWPTALAVWVGGLLWAVLSHFEIIRPREVGLVLGSIGLVVGSMMLQEQSWGSGVALATVAAIVGVAVLERRMSLLAVGAAGTLSVLPQAMGTWFGGMLAPALALLVAGLGLVATAVYIARTGRH